MRQNDYTDIIKDEERIIKGIRMLVVIFFGHTREHLPFY